MRARIVWACAGDTTHQEIARVLRTTPATVGKWRNRLVKNRLPALGDAPRRGPPRSVTEVEVEQIITRTLERKPQNATHWSTRPMAKESGWSRDTIRRIWRAFGLPPHRQEQFKLSPTLSGWKRCAASSVSR